MSSSILINDTRVDHHHGCERVVSAIDFLSNSHGFPIKQFFSSHQKLVGTDRFEAALNDCDVVLVNGEGTLHHDRPAGLELLSAAVHAKKLGKYVVLLNAGWEANTKLLGQYLKSFDLIAARDKASQLSISEFNVECHLTPDLSTFLPSELLPCTIEKKGLAYTDSVIPDLTLALWKQCLATQGEMLSIQFPMNTGFQSRYKFVREAIGRQHLKTPLDLLNLVRVRSEMLVQSTPSTVNWLQKLAGYSLLVSGRFHACTLAILLGVPFVALGSNTKKITNLISDAGLDPKRLLKLEEMKNIKATDWEYSSGEKASLEQYLSHGRRTTNELFEKIKSEMCR